MGTFRFDLDNEYSKRLETDAADHHMNVQEYIRYRLFGKTPTAIFNVHEVLRRIQTGNFAGKKFTVADVYTNEEWSEIDRGKAGVLGRNFYIYVNEHPELGIHFIPNKTIKRRATYYYEGK